MVAATGRKVTSHAHVLLQQEQQQVIQMLD
jgi:hypothetical protein